MLPIPRPVAPGYGYGLRGAAVRRSASGPAAPERGRARRSPRQRRREPWRPPGARAAGFSRRRPPGPRVREDSVHPQRVELGVLLGGAAVDENDHVVDVLAEVEATERAGLGAVRAVGVHGTHRIFVLVRGIDRLEKHPDAHPGEVAALVSHLQSGPAGGIAGVDVDDVVPRLESPE